MSAPAPPTDHHNAPHSLAMQRLAGLLSRALGFGGADAEPDAASASASSPGTSNDVIARSERLLSRLDAGADAAADELDEFITPTTPTTLASEEDASSSARASGGKILFGSQTGTARRLAHKLSASLRARHGLELDVVDARDFEPESLSSTPVAVVILSTYEDDDGAAPPENARWLCRWVRESAMDERVGALHLAETKYAVFGCGNREYGVDRFNAAARALDADLARLGAARLLRRADGDESGGRMEDAFHEWADKLAARLTAGGIGGGGMRANEDVMKRRAGAGARGTRDRDGDGDGGGKPLAAAAAAAAAARASSPSDTSSEDVVVDYDTDAEEGSGDDDGGGDEMSAGSEDDLDMEDIGGGGGGGGDATKEKREMVTPQLREALTKQGYKILGSHSGVKLCRWTKAMLRGRGGCYKHSFYGIESHRCMETTPSLACANKCVFCWRHHTNPVGREWRWQMDDPLTLVTAAIDGHRGMIKQMKGVPGVVQTRFDEGMDPRHCALSLVGEPIMYPEIAKFVSLLHERRISTFLVTNAQFPDAIVNLPAITQLYVSVDAATPETLKAIDRPLFGDYWVRLVCLVFFSLFFWRLFVKQRPLH